MGDGGASVLAELLPPGLTKLWLRRNRIGDKGARALAERLPAGLRTLTFSGNAIRNDGARALAKRLPASLADLDLSHNGIGAEGARALVERLPASLASLDLSLGAADQEVLLEWLGSNVDLPPYVERLFESLDENNRGRARLIVEANRRQRSAMKAVVLSWKGEQSPRHVRVLLCGDGKVGKTTIRRALLRTTAARCWPRFQRYAEARTKGMEVVYLRKSDLTYALWDMGGQREFHVLHSFLMPDTSPVAGKTTLFVLVLSLDNSSFKEGGISLLESLNYWLQLIASTTGPAQARQVLVVVNRWNGEKHDITEGHIQDQFAKVRRVFRSRLDIHDQLQFLDASRSEVGNLWSTAVKLSERAVLISPLVPTLCVKVLEKLQNRRISRHHPIPILGWAGFRNLVLETAGGVHVGDSVVRSVGTYLQDVGQVVCLKKPVESFVIDPSWLGHDVAGKLLGLRVDGAAAPDLLELGLTDGAVKLDLLERFYQRQIDTISFRTPIANKLGRACCFGSRAPEVSELDNNMTGAGMVELLEAISLCTVRGNRVLIPALLDSRDHVLEKWLVVTSCVKNAYCVGRRLCCKDKARSILGSPFFHKLQADMRGVYTSDEHLGESILLGNGLVYLECSGVAILLEYDEKHEHHVDILAVPMQGSTDMVAVAKALNEMAAKVRTIAALDRIGVQLVPLIIMPIECGLAEFPNMHDRNAKEAQHIIMLNRRFVQVGGIRVRLSSLLLEEDLTEVKGHLQVVEEIHSTLVGLLPPDATLSSSVARATSEIEDEATRDATELGEKERALADYIIAQLGPQLIDRVDRGFSLMQRDLQDIQRSLQEILGAIGKLGEQLGCLENGISSQLKSMESCFHLLPRYPFLCKQRGGNIWDLWLHNMQGLWQKNRAHLHLACEGMRAEMAHEVPGQEGRAIGELREWVEKALPVLNWTVAVMLLAIKLGTAASGTPGISAFLPSGDSLQGLAPFGDQVRAAVKKMNDAAGSSVTKSAAVNASSSVGFSRDKLNNAAALSHELVGQVMRNGGGESGFRQDFGLMKVQFPDGSVRWVCNKCKDAGKGTLLTFDFIFTNAQG